MPRPWPPWPCRPGTPQPKGWWHVPGPPLPGDFNIQARLEEQACALLGYEPAQIPALLQTPGYARALITGTHPGADSEVADRLVDECLARQVLVTRAAAPLPVTLILSEALMRCPVGEPLTLAG